ncbi:MAG: ATP-binding protein [Candidatus Eremiobacteraeota bacterium]|nr:ATP-binding protein [Candidatus Eremiobacteraeota bacterium]
MKQAADWLEEGRDQLVEKSAKKIYNIIKPYRKRGMPIAESRKTMDITLGYIIDFLRNKEFSLGKDNGFLTVDLIKFEDGITSRRVVFEIKLRDLLRGIKIFRDEIWIYLSSKMSDEKIRASSFFQLEKRINTFVNYIMIQIADSYIKNLNMVIKSQEDALQGWEEVVKSASNIDLKVPCRNEFAVIVRMQAEAIARRVHYSEEEVQDIKTAVGEACDNAIEHGKSEKGIDVHYHLTMEELRIEISDYGPGFDSTGMGEEPPDPFAERGRGVFLMKALMDKVEIYSKPGEGSMVIVSKKRKFK